MEQLRYRLEKEVYPLCLNWILKCGKSRVCSWWILPKRLDLLNQQARLSKAQRQLGALVYSLHKAGEENPALVEKYINAVAEVEKAIEEIKANMTDDERAEVEAQETAETEEAPAEEPAAEKTAESEETIEEEPVHLRGETKICPVCKAEVDGDAMFCNHCGAQL